jgi:hypothetical protein
MRRSSGSCSSTRSAERSTPGPTVLKSISCRISRIHRGFLRFLSPVREDERWLTGLLARAPIRAAVVNTAPLFSPPLDSAALAVLEQRFPSAVRVAGSS